MEFVSEPEVQFYNDYFAFKVVCVCVGGGGLETFNENFFSLKILFEALYHEYSRLLPW